MGEDPRFIVLDGLREPKVPFFNKICVLLWDDMFGLRNRSFHEHPDHAWDQARRVYEAVGRERTWKSDPDDPTNPTKIVPTDDRLEYDDWVRIRNVHVRKATFEYVEDDE